MTLNDTFYENGNKGKQMMVKLNFNNSEEFSYKMNNFLPICSAYFNTSSFKTLPSLTTVFIVVTWDLIEEHIR